MEALTKLHITIIKALTVNPNINIEVFIHKADTLSDDYKIGIVFILFYNNLYLIQIHKEIYNKEHLMNFQIQDLTIYLFHFI